MTIRITELGVVIPGKVTRKYDEGANATTLTLTEQQARETHESLTQAVRFFDGQAGAAAGAAAAASLSADAVKAK